MVERSSISQVIQIGVEVTPGTLVAAPRRLASVTIEPGIQTEIDSFRSTGYKYPTVASPNKEWMEAGLGGKPTYNELPYLLSSAFGTPTVTAGTAPSQTWLWTPSSTTEDTPKTFTVEQGSAVRAHRFGNGLVTEFGLDIARDGLDISGSMIGTRIEEPVTLTAAPTSLAVVPVLPSEVCVYMDALPANIGTTKLTRLLSINPSVGSRFGPLWVLDCDLDSWAAAVETEPDASFTVNVEANAQGMSILPVMRLGDIRFFRIEATGPIITGAINYRFRWDIAGRVTDVGDFSDEDGVFAIEWTFGFFHDSTWGKAYELEVVNTLAAL